LPASETATYAAQCEHGLAAEPLRHVTWC